MSSPFDFAKSILQTKEDLYTSEELFVREYAPFMINRIMSNTERTVLFAECMDKYVSLDKKVQYDFYMKGVPKNRGYSKMWSKKESDATINTDHVEYICQMMNVSTKRGTEIYNLLGSAVIEAELSKHGGKYNGKTRTQT